MKKQPYKPETKRAIALVTVLLIVAMLSILVIAYLSSMVTEHRASNSYVDTQRAKLIAHGGLAHAIEILRTNIPEPAKINESAETAPGMNWSINPGRLIVFDEHGKETKIPLHTGIAVNSPDQTNDPDVYSVDLNEPVPGKKIPAITYAFDSFGEAVPEQEAPLMRVKWVNILQDPSLPPSDENPIVARHAFWIDDESGKINFNTALGKPSRIDDPEGFHQQLRLGMMPPLFRQGAGNVEYNKNSSKRQWALGKLRSVNLDVLFSNQTDLNKEQLIAHTFLRGFSRYPEAILDHVQMPEKEKMDWWYRNRYNLTFYSRSPEFNAFGRPRLMTTNIPLSLEGGPGYQLPFVYNGPDASDTLHDLKGVLHMHTLLGSLGFTHRIFDENEGWVHAANVVNRAQLEMMMRYFRRQFPGYDKSFVDKYGEEECAQIALNMMAMARMATTTMSGGFSAHSRDLALRSTSVIYSPHGSERPGRNPERHYWRFEPGKDSQAGKFLSKEEESSNNTIPMLPQTPGPHITEIRLVFRSFLARKMPSPLPPEESYKDNPIFRGSPIPTKRWLGFRFEVEYYMHGLGPYVRLRNFPFKTDYLELDISGDDPFIQEFGPDSPENAKGIHRWDKNWNYDRMRRDLMFTREGEPILDKKGRHRRRSISNRRSLRSLQVWTGASLGPYDESIKPEKQRNRRIIRGPWRFIGKEKQWLGNPEDPKPSPNDLPREFDVSPDADTNVDVTIRFRGGMGANPGAGRPRQMIPLGETKNDTLEGQVKIDLRSNEWISLSWQTADPRLSVHKNQWWLESPDDNSAGTPGKINVNKNNGNYSEPEEGSTEKSKYRYIQRAHGGLKIAGFKVDRPDEYNSRSRVSSKGFWSMLHTGIQSQTPWRTIRLSPPETDDLEGPPDWLLMDLLGGTYPLQHDQWKINSTLPDEFSTTSYMHSTTGAINLNNKTYPDDSPYFQAPERTKPLEAVFKHLRSDDKIKLLIDGIQSYQNDQNFKYVGELSKVDGYLRSGNSATQFQNEELLRNMIGCLTTKSNTFGVWGAGQVVKKIPGNEKWDQFEDGDVVQGEKRFFAIVERYIWPGKDGVPGNAHVDSQGVWDRHAKGNRYIPPKGKGPPQDSIPADGSITDRLFQLPGSPPTRKNGNNQRLALELSGTYPEFDGPQEVEMGRYASRTLGKVKWTSSSLEDAYNPPQPAIKYRVVYLRYIE